MHLTPSFTSNNFIEASFNQYNMIFFIVFEGGLGSVTHKTMKQNKKLNIFRLIEEEELGGDGDRLLNNCNSL